MVELTVWSDDSSEGKLPIKKKRKLNIVILKQQRILCILCHVDVIHQLIVILINIYGPCCVSNLVLTTVLIDKKG